MSEPIEQSDVVTQEVIDGLMAIEVQQMTTFGANIMPDGKIVCGCLFTEKKDLGPLEGELRRHLNIYKCEAHRTIMVHNKFGEVI